MGIDVLPSVISSLTRGDVSKSVLLMRSWLQTAEPGEPEALLAEAPASMRPRLALLLRDLMARYPATILGAPVLLYISESPSGECLPPLADGTRYIELPFPTGDSIQPCSDLHFLGWLPADAQLPLQLPFRPERHKTKAPLEQMFACVALFRSNPDVFDYDTLELPNLWWGELLRPVDGNIQLSARLLLPYPDALEAARVLQASARGETLPKRTGFLSDNGWAWATDSGLLFYETCRRYNPEQDEI